MCIACIAYIKMYMGTILLTKYFEPMPRGKKAQQFCIRLLIISRVTCHVSHAPPLHECGQRCPQLVSPAIFLTATFLLRAGVRDVVVVRSQDEPPCEQGEPEHHARHHGEHHRHQQVDEEGDEGAPC